MFFNLPLQLVQFISCFFVVIMFLILFVTLWYNRKFFYDLFKNINRFVLIILLAIIIIFSLSCVVWGENFSTFISTDQEWEELRHAQELISGELIYNHFRHGLVYPLILSFGFIIFGVSSLIASILNFILAIFSIFLVFVLAQTIFKNSKISLIAVFLYTSTPLVFIFSGMEMGYPILITFFLLLTTISAILYFRYHKVSLLIQTVTLIALISQIKPEYFIVIFPFIFCFLILKEYKRIPFKKLIVIIILFLIFSSAYFDKSSDFRKSYKDMEGWCGHYTQAFQRGQRVDYSLPFVNQLDVGLKFLATERMSFYYFIYDLPNFLKFWTFGSFLFMFFFSIIGIILKFKKYKKEYLYTLTTFLSIAFLYLVDCGFYEFRFAFPLISYFVIFAATGIYFVFDKLVKKDKNYLIRNILIILIVLIISTYWHFNDFWINQYQPVIMRSHYKNITNRINLNDIYTRLKKLTENIPTENSNFIVPHNDEQDVLIILGYSSANLYDLLKIDYIKAENKEDYLKSIKLPLRQNYNNYFLRSKHCRGEADKLCNFIINNYSLKEVKNIGDDKLYLFLDI